MANEIDTEATSVEPDEAPSKLSFGVHSRDALPLVAAAAGLAGGLSGQQPTGNLVADFLLSFAIGWGLVWFSQHAGRQAVLLTAVASLFFSGFTMPAIALAVAATACVLIVTEWKPFDSESVTIGLAVSAAFASQAVLHLPTIVFVRSASLFAAVSMAPIVIAGYRRLRPEQRRPLNRGLLAAVAFAFVATVLAVVAALGIRAQVETGIEQAQDGVAALQNVDRTSALELLGRSEQNFQTASDRLSGPLTWPARFVPVTAQHSRALETAATQGLALARTAARTGAQADVERIRGSNGAIDLDIVQAVNSELVIANSTLRSARQSLLDVTNPWLVPQLTDRLDDVQEELAIAATDIDLANHATSVLPGILGANGLRRYLILFVQPAESREFGGFVGAYGIMEADNGRLNLTESGNVFGLGFGQAQFEDFASYPEAYAQIGPQLNPQNLTATADLETIARAAREFIPQWRQNPDFTIDGVISIDPYALAGLVELSGPLRIEGRATPLDSTNVADFLIRDQYLEFDPIDRAERQDVLRVLAGQAFDRLFSIEIPGPERLGSIFGPLARADRLSFVTFDPLENEFLDRVFLSANMPVVGSAVDMVGIYGQTGTASKLDGYATRSSVYEVTIDPGTGELTGDLTVTERNDAPADAGDFVLGRNVIDGPAGDVLGPGSNSLAFGLYTRAEVTELVADTAFRIEDALPTYSYDRHPIYVEVPLGGQATISMSNRWQVQPGRYDIVIPAQATANPSEFTLTIRPAEGWVVADRPVAADGSWTETFTLDEARTMTFLFEETPQ